MSRLKDNVPKCCEDHKGERLCIFLVGCYCGVRRSNEGYILVTRDGLELLQQVGCASFAAIVKYDKQPEAECRCWNCADAGKCEYEKAMWGMNCPKHIRRGVT